MTKAFMSRAEQRRWNKFQERKRAFDRSWSEDEIRGEFDCNPNLTIAELAVRCGRSASEVKRILLTE